MLKTNPKTAAVEMAKALKEIFKKYSLNSRTIAWDTLTSKKGQEKLRPVLIHPDKPINTIQSLSFKEWAEQRDLEMPHKRIAWDTPSEVIKKLGEQEKPYRFPELANFYISQETKNELLGLPNKNLNEIWGQLSERAKQDINNISQAHQEYWTARHRAQYGHSKI